MSPRPPVRSVDELIDLLERLDGQATSDVVAALPHLLQTAEALARTDAGDPELVVAGLVHDLASAVDPGCPDHGPAGADLVRSLLGARVATLVAGHTEAKRYLVTVEPTYAGTLSQNSSFTLIGQGGPMDRAELDHFEGGPDFDALVRLRRADDAAKVPGAAVRPAAAWRSWLDQVAASRA